MSEVTKNLRSYQFKTNCQMYQRIGHRVLLLDQNILVFGGINYHCDFVSSILSISCQTYQVFQLSPKNCLPLQGFGLCYLNNEIFLWGGKKPSGISDQLWKMKDNMFSKIIQFGDMPKPRQYFGYVLFANRYLVIYGGIDEQQVFNDWYLLCLNTFTWTQIQANINLPLNCQPKMVWISTRGVLLISQIWNFTEKKINACCLLYEFKIRLKQGRLVVLLQQLNYYSQQKLSFNSCPSLCPYTFNSTLYLCLIGGQCFPQTSSEIYLLNLQTLQLYSIQNVKLQSKYGIMMMIGGIVGVGEFMACLEVLDFDMRFISIDRKLCKTCQVVYGLEDYSKNKLAIKCQYTTKPTCSISAKLIQKFSSIISNPLSAIGLLLDNSMNMNSSLISLKILSPVTNKKFQLIKKNVLQIIDNSYGFSRQQILQSFYTFGFKMQTFTHDIKFQEELMVRKQYGVALKLAVLRLGKACLFVTNTIQNQIFVGYFSIRSQQCNDGKFNCFHYFINNQANVSSMVNRHIIKQNIQNFINLEEIQKKQAKTKIYIIDFDKRDQLTYKAQQQSLVALDYIEQQQIFSSLCQYISNLYIKPYSGRLIKFCSSQIICRSPLQVLKQEQLNKNLQRLNMSNLVEEISNFQQIYLYKIIHKKYNNRRVLIYSNNRLITCFLLQSLGEQICGLVQLKNYVSINIGKCGIQNQNQQKQIIKYIAKLCKASLQSNKINQNKSKINQNKRVIDLSIIQNQTEIDANLGKSKKKTK